MIRALERRLTPISRKRLRRFREMRRAYGSFWLLLVLYVLSLGAELLCNNVPLLVRYQGHWYLPVLRFVPDDRFTGSGLQTRPDYARLSRSPAFAPGRGNFMVFAPLPVGPYQIVAADDVRIPDRVTVSLTPEPRLSTVNVSADLAVSRAEGAGWFFGVTDDQVPGRSLSDLAPLPEPLLAAVAQRFANQAADPVEATVRDRIGRQVTVSLSTFRPRAQPPKSVRVTLGELLDPQVAAVTLVFARGPQLVAGADAWARLEPAIRDEIRAAATERFSREVPAWRTQTATTTWRAVFAKEELRFPFRPVRGHWLGIDAAGRDVLARIVYGFRTSLTFGLILVVVSMALGIVVGAVQGYLGGVVDITGQRLIEVWSALPFFYIMILMGAVYGRGFLLLIVCYALFNWIGISYYMRAEFLRLRGQPFVEAAKCLGLPGYKIVLRHILPNALVPVITFFPFSLVGAIGSLTALDYLGFGLPPPTPSWGELLFQAQQYRSAWWLILYPSLALFVVMLLGVFIGEGVRNAYDPRRFSRME